MAQAPHKLSTGEINALVGGLMDFGDDDGELEARAYEFGADDLSLMGDYYALRMINERFCRIARTVFLPMLRIQPRISAFPPEVKKFDEYSDGLDNFVSLNISRINELRGSMLITMDHGFVSLLTDSYFGGAIRETKGQRTEFTSTEQRVIEIVTSGLNRALEAAWRDLTTLTFVVQNREENLQFASFVDNDDLVVICSFFVQLPDYEPATIDIIYPLQTLKPIAAQLRSRMQSDAIDDDTSWRDKLANALLDVRLDVTARLDTPKVPLKSLMHLSPGAVVPVNLDPNPQLLITDRPFFEIELGEQGGKSAVSIGAMIKRNDKNLEHIAEGFDYDRDDG